MRPALPLAAALALLAACGDVNRTPVTMNPASKRISTSGNDTTHAPMPVIPGVEDTLHHPPPPPPPLAATAALAPLGAATLRGEARLATAGTGTAVATALAGGQAGMTYSGAIRAGACDRMGVTVAQLVPVTADSAGTGRSAGDVGISLDSLLRHPYVVTFGPGGRPAACGALRGGGIGP